MPSIRVTPIEGNLRSLAGVRAPAFLLSFAVLTLKGSPLIALTIVAHQPAGLVKEPVSHVDITFDREILAASFGADDVVMQGPDREVIPVETPLAQDATTWRISFAPQTAPRWYRLRIGPHVQDLSGIDLDQDGDGIPGEDTEDIYVARFCVAIGPEQSVLCVNVHGSSYDADGASLHRTLVDAGVDAVFVNLSIEGQVRDALAEGSYGQVWIFDLSEWSNIFTSDWQAISDWFNRDPSRAIICDGRIISSYWYGQWPGEGRKLSENYYENLKVEGGGLLLGTDHYAYQSGINTVNGLIGLEPFEGYFDLSRIPVDAASPLMGFPNDLGGSLLDDSSPGQTPYGLQPSGRILYTVAWHGGNANQPGISTTIPPLGSGINCRVKIVSPAEGACFPVGAPVLLRAETEKCELPVSFAWISSLDGPLGGGFEIETESLSLGRHIITVQVVDSLDGADEDRLALSIEVPFRRGDVQFDSRVDLTDAMSILGCLFLDEKCPICWDSADGNDDGFVEISDAIYLLNYEFLAASPPPAPFPDCGVDPTDDGLTCDDYSSCP
jgi:hypothetical protein